MSDPDLKDLEPTLARVDAVGREDRRERLEAWAAGPAPGEEQALAALRDYAAAAPARSRRRRLAWAVPVAAALALAFFLWRGADQLGPDTVLGPEDPPVIDAPEGLVDRFSHVRWSGVLPRGHEWVAAVLDEDGEELARSDPQRENVWAIPADRVADVRRVTVRVLVVSEDGVGAITRRSEDVEAWLSD